MGTDRSAPVAFRIVGTTTGGSTLHDGRHVVAWDSAHRPTSTRSPT